MGRKCSHPSPRQLPTGEMFCPHCLMTLESKPFEAPRKPSKYNSVRCKEDGFTFDSMMERRYYRQLKQRKEAGDLQYFLRQVPFDLPGNIRYFCDFMVVENDGSIRYIDVKGVQSRVFINKKKQVEALYPVKVEVVKA